MENLSRKESVVIQLTILVILRILIKINKNKVCREYLNKLKGGRNIINIILVIILYILANSKTIKELECGMFTSKIGGGNYDQEGLKFGKWKDFQDMSNGEKSFDQDKIYIGEFKQGIRIGRWSIWYQSHHIGGGGYDNNGLKQGYWIDPEEDYDQINQITFRGVYKDSRRIGEWSIHFQNHEIGGGNYNDKGQKQGQWIENQLNYSYQSQLTLQGEYHEDVKIGQWVILYKRRKIGGGLYDNQGFKQGIWTETAPNFDNWKKKMLTGDYNNDKRNGVWKEMIDDETNYIYYINGEKQEN